MPLLWSNIDKPTKKANNKTKYKFTTEKLRPENTGIGFKVHKAILALENTGIEFKVHKAILALKSLL